MSYLKKGQDFSVLPSSQSNRLGSPGMGIARRPASPYASRLAVGWVLMCLFVFNCDSKTSNDPDSSSDSQLPANRADIGDDSGTSGLPLCGGANSGNETSSGCPVGAVLVWEGAGILGECCVPSGCCDGQFKRSSESCTSAGLSLSILDGQTCTQAECHEGMCVEGAAVPHVLCIENGGTPVEGLYRTLDGGDSWTNLDLGPASPGSLSLEYGRATGDFFGVAISDSSPEVVYVNHWTGLYRSTDGGDEWSVVVLDEAIEHLDVHPVDGVVYAFDADHRLHTSQDQGESWTESLVCMPGACGDSGAVKTHSRSIALHPKNPAVLYAAGTYQDLSGGADDTHTNLLRSEDGGATWGAIGPPTQDHTWGGVGILCSPSNPDNLYLGLKKSPRLWTSDDAGDTWLAVPDEEFGSGSIFAVAPNDAAVLYKSVAGRVEQSVDGGHSWTVHNPSKVFRFDRLLLAADGAIYGYHLDACVSELGLALNDPSYAAYCGGDYARRDIGNLIRRWDGVTGRWSPAIGELPKLACEHCDFCPRLMHLEMDAADSERLFATFGMSQMAIYD